MKLLKSLLVILFCSQAALVWADDKSHDQLVDELAVKSGVQRQVEQIPEVVKVSVEQRLAQDTKMSAEEKVGFKSALVESFDPAAMLKTVKAGISAGLSNDDINIILLWLNSPLGQKITALEEGASSAKAYQDMRDFAMGLQSNPPADKRLAAIEQFDKAAHMTESSVKMKMDMSLAMAEAMSCTMDCNNFSKEQVVAQLEQARPQFEQGSQQETMISALFTYQTLTDNELEQYIQFYETAVGQKYMTVVTDALSASIKNASKVLGEKVGMMIKEKKAIAAPKQ